MNTSTLKMKTAFASLVLAASTLAAPAAHADVIYNFGSTGIINGTGFTPAAGLFATAKFTDSGVNSVTLVMNVLNNLPGGAFVSQWAFNLLGTATITTITNTAGHLVDTSGGNASSTPPITSNDNNAKLASATGFDFQFNFTTGANDLANGQSSTYTLVGTNLTAASFLAATTAHYAAAVKVQGYGNSAEYQQINHTVNPITNVVADIPVPEPTSIALLGLGFLSLATMRRRKNSNV